MNWQELADKINEVAGHQLLVISFLPKTQTGFMHYERSLIQRVLYHESLFSIHLGWTALFHPFTNSWFYMAPPKKDASSVQILDGNTLNKQPSLEENNIVRISYRAICTTSEYEMNPVHSKFFPIILLDGTEDKFPEEHFIETGMFIIPPELALKEKYIKIIE